MEMLLRLNFLERTRTATSFSGWSDAAGTEEQAVYNAENCGVGAYTEGQDGGESGDF